MAVDPRSDLIQYAECDAAAGIHFCESTRYKPTVPCVNTNPDPFGPALFKRPGTSPSTSPSNRPSGESGGTAPAAAVHSVGHRNWAFFGSHESDETAASVANLILHASGCGIEPFAWLRHVLWRVCRHAPATLNELLRHS
jgi:hypothetical protein